MKYHIFCAGKEESITWDSNCEVFDEEYSVESFFVTVDKLASYYYPHLALVF